MYQRILVPVDGSPPSRAGLDEAIRLAKLTGGQIRALHVVETLAAMMGAEAYTAVTVDLQKLFRESGEAILSEARDKALKSGIAADTLLLDGTQGRLVDHVQAQVRDWGADLVVIGTHGRRGVSRLLLGSDAHQVLSGVSVPALVVRAPAGEAASG